MPPAGFGFVLRAGKAALASHATCRAGKFDTVLALLECRMDPSNQEKEKSARCLLRLL